MRIKDALANIHKEHTSDKLHHLWTTWGERLNRERIWQEYPRPQMRRGNYRMLHGEWEYAIVPATGRDIFESQGKILVPFSPESLLSGVGRQLQPDEFLWYKRELWFAEDEWERRKQGDRCLLHFDAVDQEATVYLNGVEVLHHVGGYLPFEIDITDYMVEQGCILMLRVRDASDTSYHARGKQTLKRGGMFYTAQSGIWQSVWYEWVPGNYVQQMKITPDYDNASVNIELVSAEKCQKVEIVVEDADVESTVATELAKAGAKTILRVHFRDESFKAWSPEQPHLYSFTVKADEDVIHGYFAMRTFTIEKDDNEVPRFCLNHRPYFLHGVLDQGYWPDGLMTAPCDEALVYDITLAKKCGFNMIRKHIKIEMLRWYYHCDRLGMIVWQDMVNGGSAYHMPFVCYLPTALPVMGKIIKDNRYRSFSRSEEEGRAAWEQECKDTVEHLYNVPSISTWVPFNEAWGQFDAARIAESVKSLDPTRTVDHASGWFDQKAGDFRSVHNYFRRLRVERDAKRAFVISEYGGFACHIKEHSSVERCFGYKKYEDLDSLTAAFGTLMKKEVEPLIEQGLSGAVYTQLSDIEEEVNGLVTYDRRVIKIKEGTKICI